MQIDLLHFSKQIKDCFYKGGSSEPTRALNVIVKNVKTYYNNIVAVVTNVIRVGTSTTCMSLPVFHHWEVTATFNFPIFPLYHHNGKCCNKKHVSYS